MSLATALPFAAHLVRHVAGGCRHTGIANVLNLSFVRLTITIIIFLLIPLLQGLAASEVAEGVGANCIP